MNCADDQMGVRPSVDSSAATWLDTHAGRVALVRVKQRSLVTAQISELAFPSLDRSLAESICRSLFGGSAEDILKNSTTFAGDLARCLIEVVESDADHRSIVVHTAAMREAKNLIEEFRRWPQAGEWNRLQRELQSRIAAYLHLNVDSGRPLVATVLALSVDLNLMSATAHWIAPVIDGLSSRVPGFTINLPLAQDEVRWENYKTELFCRHQVAASNLRAAQLTVDQFNRAADRYEALHTAAGLAVRPVKRATIAAVRRTDKRPIETRVREHSRAILAAMHLNNAYRWARRNALVEWRSISHGATLAGLDYAIRDDSTGVQAAFSRPREQWAEVWRTQDAIAAAYDEITALLDQLETKIP
jgi:hypothetical protein